MTHDLTVERVYAAAPEVVFDAFTDPEAQKEMYADGPDWIVRSECDLRTERLSRTDRRASPAPSHLLNSAPRTRRGIMTAG